MASSTTNKIPWLPLILAISRQTDGRDKGLKIIQYGLKVLLLMLPVSATTSLHRSNTGKLSARPQEWTVRINNIVSSFSSARKMIRLGHVVEPWSELYPILMEIYTLYLSPAVTSSSTSITPETLQIRRQKLTSIDSILTTLNASLSTLNDLSDDICALTKIGVLDKKWGRKFEPMSHWLWLACISLDLYDAGRAWMAFETKLAKEYSSGTTRVAGRAVVDIEKVPKDLRLKREVMRASILKLLGDLGFCSYDVLDMQFSPLFQAWCALLSGYLGMYKLYLKALSK